MWIVICTSIGGKNSLFAGPAGTGTNFGPDAAV